MTNVYASRTALESRRGMAPLELVMSMPFLLAVAALTASLGWAALGKSTAAVDARNEVWKLRSKPDSNPQEVKKKQYSGTDPFAYTDLDSGMLYGETTYDFVLHPALNKTVHPTSGAALLVRTWDHEDMTEFDGSGPHLGVLGEMGIGLLGVGALADLLNLEGNLPNQDEIDQAQSDADEAKKQKEKAEEEAAKERQKIVDKINQLKAEKAELEAELAEKEQEYQEVSDQLQQLLNEKAQLELQGKPVPQSLLDSIAEKQARLVELQGEINVLKQKIVQKQQEIDFWEEQLEKLDERVEEAKDV